MTPVFYLPGGVWDRVIAVQMGVRMGAFLALSGMLGAALALLVTFRLLVSRLPAGGAGGAAGGDPFADHLLGDVLRVAFCVLRGCGRISSRRLNRPSHRCWTGRWEGCLAWGRGP